jgi:hypothetical protein
MAVKSKRSSWSRSLTRIVVTSDGETELRTLRQAADFVLKEDAIRGHWHSAARALMVASFDESAIEGATLAVERALMLEGRLKIR